MRRTLISYVLPTLFSLVPLMAGILVAIAIPGEAMRDYLKRVEHSPIDWLILGLGGTLFGFQLVLSWRALRAGPDGFDEGND